MILSFREWFESRRAATVHPEIKKWIDSADKLKQTVEKLKAIIKDKEAKTKTTKPIKVEPAEKKPEVEKPDKKPEIKPKDKVVVEPDKSKVKIEPKNIEKPTKVNKGKEVPEEEEEEDERPRRNSDTRLRNQIRN
jgi:hypothetical protein